jgi:hypothetical protein
LKAGPAAPNFSARAVSRPCSQHSIQERFKDPTTSFWIDIFVVPKNDEDKPQGANVWYDAFGATLAGTERMVVLRVHYEHSFIVRWRLVPDLTERSRIREQAAQAPSSFDPRELSPEGWRPAQPLACPATTAAQASAELTRRKLDGRQ